MAAKADKMDGLYIIEDPSKRFVYIGKSQGVGAALRSAKSKLKKGNHHNNEMQQAFFKRGERFLFDKVVLESKDQKILQDTLEDKMNKYLEDDWLLFNDIITFDVDVNESEDPFENLNENDTFLIKQLIEGLNNGNIPDTTRDELMKLAKSI